MRHAMADCTAVTMFSTKLATPNRTPSSRRITAVSFHFSSPERSRDERCERSAAPRSTWHV